MKQFRDNSFEEIQDLIQFCEQALQSNEEKNVEVLLSPMSFEMHGINVQQNITLSMKYAAEMCQRIGQGKGLNIVIKETQ